jgi:hypothetical protein
MMGKKVSDVFYQAPGEDIWQRVPSVQRRSSLAVERERVLALLAEADVRASNAVRRSRSLRNEAAAFERDMALSMGAWRRFVAAGARQWYGEAENILEDLLKKK